MLERGIQMEIKRLKWSLDLYEEELTKHVTALRDISNLAADAPSDFWYRLTQILERFRA